MSQQSKVSIRPQVTMLSVLKHIEYETWFALAEFIDNAIDSYLKNIKLLKEIEGDDFVLEVRVEINEPENRITIRDTQEELERLIIQEHFELRKFHLIIQVFLNLEWV